MKYQQRLTRLVGCSVYFQNILLILFGMIYPFANGFSIALKPNFRSSSGEQMDQEPPTESAMWHLLQRRDLCLDAQDVNLGEEKKTIKS